MALFRIKSSCKHTYAICILYSSPVLNQVMTTAQIFFIFCILNEKTNSLLPSPEAGVLTFVHYVIANLPLARYWHIDKIFLLWLIWLPSRKWKLTTAQGFCWSCIILESRASFFKTYRRLCLRRIDSLVVLGNCFRQIFIH